jgi:hypothetical protein
VFAKAWDNLGVATVSFWVTNGYSLSFLTSPPLSAEVRLFPLPNNRERKRLLLAEIVSLVLQHALVRVSLRSLRELAFTPCCFWFPKLQGFFRPVGKVSTVDCPHFKMETVDSIVRAMRPGDWSFSIDLSDAYFHGPMHPRYRRYRRVAVSPT